MLPRVTGWTNLAVVGRSPVAAYCGTGHGHNAAAGGAKRRQDCASFTNGYRTTHRVVGVVWLRRGLCVAISAGCRRRGLRRIALVSLLGSSPTSAVLGEARKPRAGSNGGQRTRNIL